MLSITPSIIRSAVRLAALSACFVSALLAAEPAGFINGLADGHARKIVTYGTSLTASSVWPAGMQKRLREHFGRKVKVVNAAGNSMDSRWGCENLTERVLREKPDVVMLEFAINDALATSKLSVKESAANLTAMIQQIHASYPRCEVIVMIMNPPTGEALQKRPNIRRYEIAYRTVASRLECRLIDFSSDWKRMISKQPTHWQAYAPDGLHPNAKAAEEVILPKLMSAFGLPESTRGDAEQS